MQSVFDWRAKLLVLFLTCASVAGLVSRSKFEIPILYGTWLTTSFECLFWQENGCQVAGLFQKTWAVACSFGTGSSIWCFLIHDSSGRSTQKHYYVFSILMITALVGTAIPLFAWPLTYIIPVAVVLSFVCAIVATVGAVSALLSRQATSKHGIMRASVTLAWCCFVLMLFDWWNLLLIGGS